MKHQIQPTFDAVAKKTPHYMVAAFTDPEDPDAPIQAITLEDGSTVVSIEAFRLALRRNVMSPRLLAKTLYHEGVHIRQLATAGWDKRSKQEMEAKACVDTFANLEPFELAAAERDNVEFNKQEAMSAYNKTRADRQTEISPFTSDPQRRGFALEFAAAQTDFETEEMERKTLEGGFAAARKAIEDDAKRRQDANERRMQEEKKAQDEKNRKVWEKVYELRWELMKALTREACKDAPAFRKNYGKTLSPETRIPEQLLLQKLRDDGRSLNACQKEVIAFFIDSDGPAMLSDLADLAWKSTSLGDPLKAVTGFFRSIQEKLKSAPTSGSDRSEPREGRGGDDRGGSAPSRVKGPAYGQLKGIAGGNSWP